MPDSHSYLTRQFDTAWKLTSHHLAGLTTEECLWRPADAGLHVHRAADGRWLADWPEHEDYVLGPPSIAWITWHLCFWWSMVLDHSFGAGTQRRDDVTWPGGAGAVALELGRLRTRWLEILEEIGETEMRSSEHTRWPFRDRPFGDVVAWVNLELTKNAAEIGYARFLYARAGP